MQAEARAAQTLTWRFDDTPAGRVDVVVSVPPGRGAAPLLIALHGQGEAFKGPARGARGWIDDYGLEEALERLASPPITRRDLQNIPPKARVATLNAALAEQPYQGLVVAMPYTPDILSDGERSLDAGGPFARFVVDQLLPKLAAETPADLERVAIDGVSLGGRMALLVGFAHPERFATVASMQAAVYPHELDVLTERARAAREKNPSLTLRLLTSDQDFYRGTLKALSKRWRKQGIEHAHVVVAGPHAYAFNRGPGAYEMLLFHDRTLRGQKAP